MSLSKWKSLTDPQRKILLDALACRPLPIRAGRLFNVCRNLRSKAFLYELNHGEYCLTANGEQLALFGRDYREPESKAARMTRLYEESMAGRTGA